MRRLAAVYPVACLLESGGRSVRVGSGALALAPREKCLVVMGGQDVPGFSGSGITPVDREQHVVHGLGVAVREAPAVAPVLGANGRRGDRVDERSEEHTSELQSLMRISYAVFCLKTKKTKTLQ